MMTNDPRDLDGGKLQRAMQLLGQDLESRKKIIALLKEAESRLRYDGPLRDDITGPIVDALHAETDRYEKVLADGTRFRFLYRTKIARDFLMSELEHPTHVWEPQTTRLLLDLTRDIKGDVIVGGAYFGDQAILVAKSLLSRNILVHCFEPNSDQLAMLTENSKINDLNNIRPNGVGLWSVSSVRLKLDGFDSFANAIPATPSEAGFQTISIDDYRRHEKIKVGLIQLDIEGAELEALKGAHETLAKDQPVIVFEVHRDYVDWTNGLENTNIYRYLADLGYRMFAIRDFNTHHEMGNKPIELIPANKVYLEGPPHGFNMVAVQDTGRFKAANFRIVENVSPKLLAHKDPALHHPLDGI